MITVCKESEVKFKYLISFIPNWTDYLTWNIFLLLFVWCVFVFLQNNSWPANGFVYWFICWGVATGLCVIRSPPRWMIQGKGWLTCRDTWCVWLWAKVPWGHLQESTPNWNVKNSTPVCRVCFSSAVCTELKEEPKEKKSFSTKSASFISLFCLPLHSNCVLSVIIPGNILVTFTARILVFILVCLILN